MKIRGLILGDLLREVFEWGEFRLKILLSKSPICCGPDGA